MGSVKYLLHLAFVPLIITVVIVITTLLYSEITRPREIEIQITDGPTVLSTQVIPLR